MKVFKIDWIEPNGLQNTISFWKRSDNPDPDFWTYDFADMAEAITEADAHPRITEGYTIVEIEGPIT